MTKIILRFRINNFVESVPNIVLSEFYYEFCAMKYLSTFGIKSRNLFSFTISNLDLYLPLEAAGALLHNWSEKEARKVEDGGRLNK